MINYEDILLYLIVFISVQQVKKICNLIHDYCHPELNLQALI
jgi:hypothetical protein